MDLTDPYSDYHYCFDATGTYGGAAMTGEPSLLEVADQLRALLRQERTRRDVSSWAAQWLTASTPAVEDKVVWATLQRLGGVDLKTSDRDYLYVEADFHAWLDEIEDAIESGG
jgi:hypothetical protein